MNRTIKSPTDAEILQRWLKTIPYGEYNNTIKRLVDECLVSRSTFNNWRYGLSRIPASGKRDINRVSLEISGIELYKIVKPEEVPVA